MGDKMIIYKITNLVNNKVYIGQTVRTLKERMMEHNRHRTTMIDKALKKYGKENFNIELLDSANTLEELNEKEIYYINYYNSKKPNGYNLCNGGDNTKGFVHREISKIKMSNKKKGKYKGSENHFFGKHHTLETRQQWSDKRKGLKHLTEEQKEKLRTTKHTVKVMCVETQEIFNSVKEASQKYNLKATHITRVCKGKRKRTGNYHWKYVS